MCGKKDFNAELFEPINRRLAAKWEKVFQRQIPRTLQSFTAKCKRALDTFYRDVATNVRGTAVSSTEPQVLDQQKRAYQMMIGEVPNHVGARIAESQRDANRGFTPVIRASMQPAYDNCVSERGKSCMNLNFYRLKFVQSR